ncbi:MULTISPECIES: chromosome segregation protein SMC [unclassified Arsukibacterium]|uniref:chromosome segregation protein SMC n=1 Tax=unclassified Arsukibacterium TaxID=2635278 RepID=UPI000C3DDE1D|nr:MULTISPECIES: chromosome segregation protein SMC [unclassified Arsukibacterium]MAA96438.1 chromosome segregation protein SMC [Rheinheimera sp.]MBM35327.1 chromosome segregation protein SMC [Rheinheimera sp.]HAW91860.1 chromosome segregation protein SMC [Candidatus Azambacteria bacterium]|tara:strand:- start:10792 stop:14205 length:3414 start_codon:yes stop_codon:yes gene_type:complete
MRLKHIKLVGFKSFVDPTQVPFPEQMTAVVGPNGCGKSNVIDAVRWVLGESSAKNLRGDAMTDVIFNGSGQRKPVSQASVELVFENTQGRLSGNMADRSEISIKRLVTREAQSSYFLNGSKCRRRDITDIFLGTGLGPRSYAIIEQGMISRLIESKPQELRVFIEEAAGISKYKERRRETENRIKHTRENLDRLADVREELAKNIEKLKRQASTAQRYKELKAQERKLKAELTTLKWLRFNNQLVGLEQQLASQETELEKYQAGMQGEQRILIELKEQTTEARAQAEQQQSRFYQLGNTISRLEQQILHQRQQQQILSNQLQQKQQALRDSEQFIASEQALLNELTDQQQQYGPELELGEAQLAELELQLQLAQATLVEHQQQWQQWQQHHFNLRQQQQQAQLAWQSADNQARQYQSQLTLRQQQLAQLQQQQPTAHADEMASRAQQLTTQRDATQHQVELALVSTEDTAAQVAAIKQQLAALVTRQHILNQEQQRLTALDERQQHSQQALVSHLAVAPGWAAAVAAALGPLQHASIGNADTLQDDFNYVSPLRLQAAPDTLASVISSGHYPDYFQNIFLADSLAAAQQRVAALAPGQSVVTTAGQWLGQNWGHSSSNDSTDSGLLRRERLAAINAELTELAAGQALAEQQLTVAQQAQSRAREALAQQQQLLAGIRQQLQQADTERQLHVQAQQLAYKQQVQLEAECQQLSANHNGLIAELALLDERQQQAQFILDEHAEAEQHLQQTQQQAQLSLQHSRERVDQHKELCRQLQTQLTVAERQQQGLAQNLQRAQLQLAQLREQIFTLEQQLNENDEPEILLQEQLQQALLSRQDAEQAMVAATDKLAGLEQKMRELEQGQQGIMQQLNQKRQQLESLRLDAEGCRVRANNMLELLREQQVNIKEVMPQLAADAEETLWQQQLDKTVEAVVRLGAINLAAIDEYEQQAERKHYLDSQHDDLTGALDTLETAIRKIDKETRQKFKETFEQVNEGLKGLFPKVFGGGSAYLDLTEDDLLETGVTIMARPPGKKNSTIHLLSGGEKALTALSLVFSIFRLNPAPFCMLDEVDAPLDDANVGRFCNLVREMSETVQFIYISHNKIAMEMAAQLMGVTMQEPGVSRVVAVDVDDAVKLAVA